MRCIELDDKKGKIVRGKKGRYRIVGTPDEVKGAMGVVFFAETVSKPNTEVVIKFVNLKEHADENYDRLTREAGFLQDMQKNEEFDQKNIVGYVDESVDREIDKFFIVLEKLQGQDLDMEVGTVALPEETIIKFSRDIAIALLHMHTCVDVEPPFLVHRDLKPDNIMVVTRNGEKHCIVIDLGTAKKGMGERPMTVGPYTPGWSCGHNEKDPIRVGIDCDIYALGRVMYYMATGMYPHNYEDAHNQGNMQKKAGEYNTKISSELSTLIDDMINYPNHEKIKTAEEVLERLASPSLLSHKQQQIVKPRQHTIQPTYHKPGPHIILGGHRYPILNERCEIGRIHNCPADYDDGDCSRGIIEHGSDGFDYPRTPDIQIPLRGPLSESIAEAHHIRIWKEGGKWYVRDLSTRNYSAVIKNNNWMLLNDEKTGEGKKETLDGHYAKLAIGYEHGGKTVIDFTFFKQ